MGRSASVTIYGIVNDAAELYRSALARCENDNPGMEADSVEQMLGTEEEPNVGGCLRMLFDPGISPGGFSIEDSSADVEEDDE